MAVAEMKGLREQEGHGHGCTESRSTAAHGTLAE